MKNRAIIGLMGAVGLFILSMDYVYGYEQKPVEEQVIYVDEEISKVVTERSFKSLHSNDSYGIVANTDDLDINSAYEAAIIIKKQQEEQKAIQEEWEAMNGDGLLPIENPDPNYNGQVIQLDPVNRDYLERLVMGEAGGEGVIGAALVAQALHDTMIKDNNFDVLSIKASYKYSGTLDREPNADVKEAVSIIFDQGGYAVKHRVIYFYAPALCVSEWHETQNFVVEYGGHRVFDRR